ncbi:MAG: tetratricopeptide repeat protein, partial [Acidobacteriaceae bacterium]|nr:tetratricopeptide repeat protein [Acidobacteriaceae bacterium]
HVGAIGNLGILYARTNRIDRAIAEYEHALRLSPNEEPVLLNLGIVYLKEELHSRALPYFERVLAMDARNQQARQLADVCRLYTGQVKPALRDLEALRQANPQDQQVLFLLGFGYLKSGDSQAAHDIFNQMFEAAGPARAEFLLGKASYEAALFSQAEESFLQVARADAQFPGVHLELGKVYISERRTEDAIRELREELRRDPENQEANYFLGSLLVQENRDEEGAAYLEKAERLKPDSYGVFLYLAKAKLHSGQPAEAVTLLEKAVELNPDDASAQYTLARALKSCGKDEAAARAFERARSLNARALSEFTIPGVR